MSLVRELSLSVRKYALNAKGGPLSSDYDQENGQLRVIMKMAETPSSVTHASLGAPFECDVEKGLSLEAVTDKLEWLLAVSSFINSHWGCNSLKNDTISHRRTSHRYMSSFTSPLLFRRLVR